MLRHFGLVSSGGAPEDLTVSKREVKMFLKECEIRQRS